MATGSKLLTDVDGLLSVTEDEAMAPLSKLSLSLRIGRGLAGSAMDGTGILGAERAALTTGSDSLENFRTSEGLSSRLPTWPWPLLLDSFQLRRWIEGLVGVLGDAPLPLAALPAPTLPFPFS